MVQNGSTSKETGLFQMDKQLLAGMMMELKQVNFQLLKKAFLGVLQVLGIRAI